MSGDMWVVFIVACVGFGAWELVKSRKAPAAPQPSPSRSPSPSPSAGARNGKAPHPHAAIIDLPGGAMRIIDIRGLPAEDLRLARLGVVQEQLLLERPITVQVWVAPVEI